MGFGIYNRLSYTLYSVTEKGIIKNQERKMSEPERQKIAASSPLTDQQKKEVDDFFLKHLGEKVPYDWHQYYQSYTGNYDKRYFPESLHAILQFRMQDQSYAKVLSDKNLLPLLFGTVKGLHIPKTFFSFANGVYRDSENRIITKGEAMEILANIGSTFIKPTTKTSSGVDCRVCDFHGGSDNISGASMEDVLSHYKGNYVCQEYIKNCEELSKLHPWSINTFRVMTYIFDGEVFVAPLSLRIGNNRNCCDNAHAGGMFIGVDDNGCLLKNAFTEKHDIYDIHPVTGIEFAGYTIPQYSRVREMAIYLQALIPQLKMVSWDLTVDDKDNVTLIELNAEGGASPWIPQMAHGRGIFGERTGYVLELLRKPVNKDSIGVLFSAR